MNNNFTGTYYSAEKIKIKVSSFVMDILNNDAQAFGFIKSNDDSNINGLVNKLLPTLLEVKKLERARLFEAAKEFSSVDSEKLCEFADIIFDSIYFYDAELENLETYIWIRPTQNTRAVFDEIIKSELPKAAVELSVYIRRLLNRYVRLPQYKREALVFDSEFEAFCEAGAKGHIIHFRYNGEIQSVFAYNYVYGYGRDQENYLLGYDIENKMIRAYPLCEVRNAKVTRNLFRPSDKLIDRLAEFQENCDFQTTIKLEENI